MGTFRILVSFAGFCIISAVAGLESSGSITDEEEDYGSGNITALEDYLLPKSFNYYGGSVCEGIPCRGSQICVEFQGGPLCWDPDLYLYGDPRRSCTSTTCLNNGVCEEKRCNCPSGVHGNNCETAGTMCSSSPCLNTGTCVTVSGGGYWCLCSPEYSGTRCEIIVELDNMQPVFDPCASQPCLNGGTCSVTSDGGFRCDCPLPYYSTTCSLSIDLCAITQCKNGGTCILVGSSTAICKCLPGFDTPHCDPENPCYSSPCLNGGTCTDTCPQGTICTTFSCDCTFGFMGPRCARTDPCVSSPCGSGQVCNAFSDESDYRCSFPPTSFMESPCFGAPCGNNGICIVVGSTFRCQYPATLPTVQVISPCASVNSCRNGGTCIPEGASSFSCKCPPGTGGELCETSVCTENVCLGDRCQCVPSCMHEYGYYCVSEDGHIGKHCDIGPPTVQCLYNGISLTIPKKFAEEYDEKSKSSFLFVAPSLDSPYKAKADCKMIYDSSIDGYVINVPRSDEVCGNRASRSSRILGEIYNNTVWVNRRTGNSLFDMPRQVFNFSCVYSKNLSVVASLKPVVDSVRTRISGVIPHRASVALCKISTCNQRCPSNLVVKGGARYTVSETIHLGIHLYSQFPRDLSLSSIAVNSAFLSCSDTDQRNDIVILEERCTKTPSLELKYSQTDVETMCMSFRVPRMRKCEKFYIHIRMTVCTKTTTTTNCPDGTAYRYCLPHQGSRSRRRALAAVATSDYNETLHVIGPIFINAAGIDTITYHSDGDPVVVSANPNLHKQPEATGYATDNALFIAFVATFVFVLVIAVVLLGVVFYRKKLLR